MFMTKRAKIDTIFLTQTAEKPCALGRYTYTAHISKSIFCIVLIVIN